ncbi:MAG TPA: MmgE/PrpD family protein [Solirubrobacterales bacterium]
MADWIVSFEIDSAPDELRAAARKALINSIGTAVAAYRLPDVQRLLEITREEEASGPATVLVAGDRTAPQVALLPNAALFNVLTQEETHVFSGTHPSETTVPIVLTLGERLHCNGKQLLEALIVGIETTVACASMELTPEVKVDNCQGPAVYGTIGAAAAAAKLYGLDREQTTNALGLAVNITAGLAEAVHVGTSEYHFNVPHASQAGWVAAALARKGAVAAATAFEGYAGFYQLFGAADRDELAAHDVVGDVMGHLEGAEWGTAEVIYKPYPVYFFNQSLVDGARKIRESDGFDPEAIESVRVEIGTFAMASGGPNQPPYADRDNVLGASGFCVASMLLRGSLGLADTQDVAAPDILGLLEKTDVVGVDGLMTGRIQVRTGDGEYGFDDDSEGRDYRLSQEEVEAIYREAAANTYSEEQAERVLALLREVEDLDDVATLVAAMTLEGEAS